jgi:predicted Zn-dependent protease
MQVDSPESKEWVRSNFNKLGNFTLLDPDKVIRMVYNLEQSGMGSEIKTVLEDLYRVNSNDVYTNDLLATLYFNTNQPDLELEVRERLRSLDPLNYQLELNLARAYSRKGDRLSLEQSVARIKAIAPDSQESKEAQELLAQFLPKP